MVLHPVSFKCNFFSSSATVGEDITAQASSPEAPITEETSPCDNDLLVGDGIRMPMGRNKSLKHVDQDRQQTREEIPPLVDT